MIHYDPELKDHHWPHWAPGAAEYLANQIRKDDCCFEWGGGMSTPWLCELVPEGRVTTIESNPNWATRIFGMTQHFDNFGMVIRNRDEKAYVTEVDRNMPFSVYLIDGYQRIKCLRKALELVRTGNLLVLDDALDYVGNWHPPGVKVFSMPHPLAGKKVTRNLWGNTHLKVGDLHHETKETWVWRVD